MAKTFFEAVKARRTYYGIGKEISVSDARIQQVLQEAILHTPSAFNSQSARVVLLLGKEHDALWALTKETLRSLVPADKFAPTEEKINSFQAGYGTVLFFEDQSVVAGLQAQFPLYQDHFPLWSNHSSGMLQFVVWTALEQEGLGASLQHYAPLIDEGVQQKWGVPKNWKLIAQMPFGQPTAAPGDKTFNPIEERFKVYHS